MGLFGLGKSFARAFDLVLIKEGSGKSVLELTMEDITLVELKTTQKKLLTLPLGFFFGATGTTLALTFMTWVMTTNYPINFGGKPYWPVPSFIPITFELTVLFSAWGMTLTYLVRNKLWPGRVPRIYDKRTTDDRFALVFDAEKISAQEISDIKSLCTKEGAVEVKDKVFAEGEGL